MLMQLLLAFLSDELHVVMVCATTLFQEDEFLVIWMRARVRDGFLDELL